MDAIISGTVFDGSKLIGTIVIAYRHWKIDIGCAVVVKLYSIACFVGLLALLACSLGRNEDCFGPSNHLNQPNIGQFPLIFIGNRTDKGKQDRFKLPTHVNGVNTKNAILFSSVRAIADRLLAKRKRNLVFDAILRAKVQFAALIEGGSFAASRHRVQKPLDARHDCGDDQPS